MALYFALEALAGISVWTISQTVSTAFWLVRGVRESDEMRMLREQRARLEEQERQLAFVVKHIRRKEREKRRARERTAYQYSGSNSQKSSEGRERWLKGLSDSVVYVESDEECGELSPSSSSS